MFSFPEMNVITVLCIPNVPIKRKKEIGRLYAEKKGMLRNTGQVPSLGYTTSPWSYEPVNSSGISIALPSTRTFILSETEQHSTSLH